MTSSEWKQIYTAKELLELDDSATLNEIKRAFREKCKTHHPDVNQSASPENDMMIKNLTVAYKILIDYCGQFKFPLIPNDREDIEPDDWWMDRFGRDFPWRK